MDPTLAVQLALSFARHYLFAQGNHNAVAYIDNTFAAWEAGQDIDKHLQAVADFLRTGQEPNFAGLATELRIATEAFLADDEN